MPEDPQSRLLTATRLVVAAAVVLTAVLFTSAAADPVNVIKLAALATCTAVAAGLLAARVVLLRTVALPRSPAAVAAVLLVVAFVAAAVTAPDTTTAILGVKGRNSGLVAYGSALALFLISLRVFDQASVKIIALAVGVAALFTASYGALQLLGLDAINWNNPFNPVIAALGNPNFAAAYLGIGAPVAVWGALRTDWAGAWRVAAGVTAFLCLVVTSLSASTQGPLAATAGLAVVALAVVLDWPAGRRRIGLTALGVATGAGLAGLAAGVAGFGPAARIFTDIGSQARVWYWQAALSMFERSPVTGVGLDSYGYFWRIEQPLAAVRRLGGENFSDAAHSVPLQHLAQGGVVLAGAYLLFVGTIVWALVTGFRRLRGGQRLLLGGLGGAWAAYQVQSLVSIDQVPLLTVHFVLAAAVIVASGPSSLLSVRLPGAPPPMDVTAQRKTKRRQAVVQPQRRMGAADGVLLAGVAAVFVPLVWLSFVPLWASAAEQDGEQALRAGAGRDAVDAYDRAADLVPGAGIYHYKKGVAYNSGDLQQEALQSFTRAFELDPYDVASVRTAARLADFRGDLALARRLYVRALELDPKNSSTILDLATFDLRHGQAARARALLEEKVEELPEVAALWASYGDALAVTKGASEARAAYARALALEPGQATAVEGLQKLQRRKP